jgi:hypothetical protein
MAYQTQVPPPTTLFSYSEQMVNRPYIAPVNQVANVRHSAPVTPVAPVPQITYGFSGRELIIPVINLPSPTIGTFPPPPLTEKTPVYMFARASSSSSNTQSGSQQQHKGQQPR